MKSKLLFFTISFLFINQSSIADTQLYRVFINGGGSVQMAFASYPTPNIDGGCQLQTYNSSVLEVSCKTYMFISDPLTISGYIKISTKNLEEINLCPFLITDTPTLFTSEGSITAPSSRSASLTAAPNLCNGLIFSANGVYVTPGFDQTWAAMHSD